MPTYVFKNKETDELEEYSFGYKHLDTFKKQNPHLERYFDAADLPVMSDGMRMSTPGTGQPDSTFEKYVINRIAESVPGNTIKQRHKTKLPREW